MMLRDATFSKTCLSVATPKYLTCCTVTGAVYQKVLHCEQRMASFTYWRVGESNVIGCLHYRANIEHLARRSVVSGMLIRRAGGL